MLITATLLLSTYYTAQTTITQDVLARLYEQRHSQSGDGNAGIAWLVKPGILLTVGILYSIIFEAWCYTHIWMVRMLFFSIKDSRMKKMTPDKRSDLLTRNFLKKQFAQLICKGLIGSGQSSLAAESMVSQMFNRSVEPSERYHPKLVSLLSAEPNRPLSFVHQAATKAIKAGEKVARTEPPKDLVPEDGANSIVNYFTECLGSGELIVDGTNQVFNAMFNTERHDLGGRSQRIAQRVFWGLLGFSISQSGKPNLWDTPS